MAFSKQATDVELRILMGATGFVSAQGVRKVEILEEGEIVAERFVKAPLTLAQVKAKVASL